MKNQNKILNISLILCIVSYMVYNVLNINNYENNILDVVYYIGTIQAFVTLAVIKGSNRIYSVRLRWSFAVLQLIILIHKLALLTSYNNWYYNSENSQVVCGLVEGVLCLIVLIYIYGLDRQK